MGTVNKTKSHFHLLGEARTSLDMLNVEHWVEAETCVDWSMRALLTNGFSDGESYSYEIRFPCSKQTLDGAQAALAANRSNVGISTEFT